MDYIYVVDLACMDREYAFTKKKTAWNFFFVYCNQKGLSEKQINLLAYDFECYGKANIIFGGASIRRIKICDLGGTNPPLF